MSIARKPTQRGTFRKMRGIFPIVPLLALALNLEALEPQSPPEPLQTAPATPSHPLDPLTAQEFAILRDILENQGKFGDKTIYNWVQLQEPPKEEDLAFQPGQKFRREAQVVAERFGTIVSPQIAGIFHQHWINLRMDFDIDGTVNAVEECNTRLLPYHPVANPKGRAFTVARTVLHTSLGRKITQSCRPEKLR